MLIARLPKIQGPRGPLTIGAIGTCRTYETIASLHGSGLVDVVWHKFAPFTQDAGMAWQYLEYCRGDLELPDWARSLAFSDMRPFTPDQELREALTEIDLYVVEISLLDQLECSGYFLNWNHVGTEFVRRKGQPLFKWWRELTDRNIRKPSLAAITDALNLYVRNGEEISTGALTILSNTKLEMLDSSGLRDHMRRIIDFDPGKTWLFASHFNIAHTGESVLRDRVKLLDALTEAAGCLGHPVFDPTPTVVAAGREVACAGNGADVHHYAPDFRKQIGLAFVDKIRAVAAERWENESTAQRVI